ncbi:hypothetical protein D3C71_1669090 [compost metagenome]
MWLIGEILLRRIQLDQLDASRTGLLQVAQQALVVAGVDDRGVIRIVLEARITFGDRRLGMFDEFLHRLFGNKHMIRRKADLAGIQ